MIKTSLKKLLRHAGLDVRSLQHVVSEETVVAQAIAHSKPAVVLDVGANIGQFASLTRSVGFDGLIVSFEAMPDAHAKLTAATSGDPRWVVAPCAALGSAPGELQMNLSGNSVSSSLLPMRQAHLEAAPESAYVGTRTVPVARLDQIALPLLPEKGSLYLKIDTQGYEMEVLRGATGLLERVTAVQVELSLIPLYEGAPTFSEMVTFLEGLGYELFSIVPGFRNVETGRMLQADGFFVKPNLSGA